VHAALGDPVRLGVVELLLLGDLAPDELAADLGLGTNLVAHHLGVLETAGLITRSRSHSDRRRRYLRAVPERLQGLVGPPRLGAGSVLFVCAANSARSQLAAALWRQRSPVPAASAGLEPAPATHPDAVATAQVHGLAVADGPRGYDAVDGQPGLVVSVCDRAREAAVPFDAPRLHWSIADPVAADEPGAFEAAYQQLHHRIGALAPQVEPL
jgi:protein-tyrosine-phosphatase